MNKNDNKDLFVDAESGFAVENEFAQMKPILSEFITHCAGESDEVKVRELLAQKLQEHLPEKTSEEVGAISDEIVSSIKTAEEEQRSLEESLRKGNSKENWFASRTKEAASAMSGQKAAEYLNNLDEAVVDANKGMYNTIMTNGGAINQNPSLDGLIAEEYHVQTFNMNAEARGSEYRAETLKNNTKNSVDIVIKDKDGKIVKRYQAKYYQDADATSKAFEDGDYRGQQKLVPADQQAEIDGKTTTVIEAPDGTTSNPLTKKDAKQMQDEAQSGNWNDLNWDEYALRDLAKGIARQTAGASLMGAAIGAGTHIAQKLWSGEEISGSEVVKTAIKSGASFGAKAAAAGAIKVGVEKGVIKIIPKGTPASTIANIVHIGVENAKIVGKWMSGELSGKEAVDKIEQTTMSTVAGVAASVKGAAIGATVGMVLGPVGQAVGGFVGGTIGYIAGSKFGEDVAAGFKKFREEAVKIVKQMGKSIRTGIEKFRDHFRRVFA